MAFGGKLGRLPLGRFKLGDLALAPPAQTLAPSFISSNTAVNPLGLVGTVTVPFITSSTAVTAPDIVSPYVFPSFISSSTAVYDPTLTLTTLFVPFIGSNTNVYPPVVQPDHLDVPFISSNTACYTPTVTTTTGDLHVPFLVGTTLVYPPYVQSDTINLGFIASATTVFAPIVQSDTIQLGFISSTTSFFGPVVQPDFFDAPFISSTTRFYPPYVQPDFIDLPFIVTHTNVRSINAVWQETTGPGNGGELFNIELAPLTSPVTATLGGNITSGSTSLTLTGYAGLPTGNQFLVLIDDEYLLLSSSGGGAFHIEQHGMSNTTPASHTAGASVVWTDTYDMAIPVLQDLSHLYTDDYEAWLVVFDSSQAYLGSDRYPTYVQKILGVFTGGTGITGDNKIDGPQISASHAPATVGDTCPVGITIPARVTTDITVGDSVVVRYKNTEASNLVVGSRAVAVQSWYGFIRLTDADVVANNNPVAHSIDGTTDGEFHAESFVTATLDGDVRVFTYGPPKYSHKGWPIAALAVRQGKKRIPLWTSPTWHNFNYVYSGFDTDATFVQILINRNDVVYTGSLDPEVALPGPQDITGPDATWDDPDDYYSATAWYVGIFGTAEAPALIGGPVITGVPTAPPPVPIPVLPHGGGGGVTGGGGGYTPPVVLPEGGSGGNIPPPSPTPVTFTGVFFEGVI